VLRDLQGFSYGEMGELLGLPEGTIKSKLHRARMELKEVFGDVRSCREGRRSMDCKEVRDRFSSLLERELMPPEEKILREHLSSCSECQRELERFEKTMRWLGSVEEVRLPEGFLPELYKKMEERKRRSAEVKKTELGMVSFTHLLQTPGPSCGHGSHCFLSALSHQNNAHGGLSLGRMRGKPLPSFCGEKT